MKRVTLILAALLVAAVPLVHADTNELYFSGLMKVFTSDAEYQQARRAEGNTPEFKLREAQYWWLKASVILEYSHEVRGGRQYQGDLDMLQFVPEGDRTNLKLGFQYARRAVKQYEALWAADKTNNRLNVLYAYAILTYVAIGSDLKKVDLASVQQLYFKARNLVNVVVARLPDNVNARYLRLLMTFDIPAASGMRPEAVILDDSKRFLADYSKLPPEVQNDREYRLYMNQVLLIRAFMLEQNSRVPEARATFARVNEATIVGDEFKKLYRKVAERLK